MSTSRSSLARLAAALLLAGCAALAAWSWATGGIVGVLLDAGRANADKVEYLRAWFAALGAAAPAAYVLAVTVEVVVAPLPGLALYAPGGLIFGGFWGGLLSLLGNVLGAGLAFLLARTLGREAAEEHLVRGRLARVEQQLTTRGAWLVFILRVNPLTSSDLVSYAAGLTGMRLRSLLLGTTAGMAPLCFAQSYAAAGLVEAFPWLIQPLLVLALVYVIAAVVWLRRILGKAAA